jgi:hypothetical protein
MKRTWVAVMVALISVTVANAAEGRFARTQESPAQTARTLLTQWKAHVTKGAKLNSAPRFAKARRATIVRIAERDARRFHYVLERVTVLRGRDGAPMVVVRVRRRPLVGFSRSFSTLWRRLDPLTRARTRLARVQVRGFLLRGD